MQRGMQRCRWPLRDRDYDSEELRPVLRLHAADSRMELAIKTHLIPSIVGGLAGLGPLTSALFAFFDSDRVCVD